jgi:hypothetical protein
MIANAIAFLGIGLYALCKDTDLGREIYIVKDFRFAEPYIVFLDERQSDSLTPRLCEMKTKMPFLPFGIC